MIIKNFEINKININKNPIILLYGKNEGLKNQIKINLTKDKFSIYNYEENEIINNSINFFEGIYSKSLFEDEKIIFVNRVTDKIFGIINEIIEKKIQDLKLILDADNLEKKSKLRSFFEKSKEYVCIPFYPDTIEILSKFAFQYLKNNKISISSSNINQLVSKCNGDRKILLMELEKISNYCKNGKKINSEKIAKLTNLIENHKISELVDNCLAQNQKKTINILVENNFNNEDCILISRILLNKLKKLLILCKEFKRNNNLELTVLEARPPIFWKEREITKLQIMNWKVDKIKETIYKINEIELNSKKNYENSIKLISDFILNLVLKKTNN